MHSFHLAFVIRLHLSFADLVYRSLPPFLFRLISLETAHNDFGSYHDRVRSYFAPIPDPLLTPSYSVDNSESSRNGDYT